MFNSGLDYKKSKKTLEEACKLWKERLIKIFDPCVDFNDNVIEIFNEAVEESKIYVKDLLTKDDVKSVLNRLKENWTILQ